jgi:hypothetical protein
VRRPQFTLKTLLWLMAVVAAFFAGAAWQHRQLERKFQYVDILADQWEREIGFKTGEEKPKGHFHGIMK